MNTHSKGLTGANLQVLDLKRVPYGLFSANSATNWLRKPEWTSAANGLFPGNASERPGATGWFAADGLGKPLAAPEHKPALSPCACFSRGERAGGVGPSGFR